MSYLRFEIIGKKERYSNHFFFPSRTESRSIWDGKHANLELNSKKNDFELLFDTIQP